jgi:phosphoribosylformylglycinamidine cyclo-ligase
VAEGEMRRVFNLGVGFVLVVSPENTDRVVSLLEGTGEKAMIIGKVSN